MKKFLFVVTKSSIGGAQMFIVEQTKMLVENGHEVFLITNKDGWLTQKLIHILKNVYVHRGIEKLTSPSFCYKVYKFVKLNKIDLVICNSANAGLYGRVGAFLANKPSIYVSHGWSSLYNGGKLAFLYNFIEYLLSFISNSILCVSKNDYATAVNKLGINSNKCSYIPNAISSVSINPANSNSNLKFKLVTVCRLDHPKLPFLLVNSVKEMSDFDLTIVGGGPLLNDLKKYIYKNDISNVKLLGELNDFSDYSNFDIFCLISKSEGLPISAIEAMSFSLPLVLSNVGGCLELINNNGFVVSNDIDSIQDAIRKCSLEYSKFSLNSLIHFNNNFNINKLSQRYLDYYINVVKKSA